jgi:carbamoyl-phosphate synthase large subunit
MKKVFVTGLGGCGVGEGIAKALRMARYEIYGSDIKPYFPYMKFLTKAYRLPPATHRDYIPTLIEICRDNCILGLYPGSELETKAIARHVHEFISAGITPMLNLPRIIETFQDSWKTYLTLYKLGYDVPNSCLPEALDQFQQDNSYPYIIKPVFGYGSKNVHVVYDSSELHTKLSFLEAQNIPVIIQKYVGNIDEEYTVGVFTDMDGRVVSAIAMKRTMIAGATLNAEIGGYAEIESYCSQLAKDLGSRGPMNFQLRQEGNKLYIFEINPRFSGTTPFRAMVGINEPDMMFRNNVLKEQLHPINYTSGKIIMRMFDEIIIDQDEIIKAKNPE